MRMHVRALGLALGLTGLAAVALPTLAAGSVRLSGAIFTTTVDGDVVNENVHYGAKVDVYLDGGPGPNAPVWAAGLPEGDYYFQVTDPSGKDLLSSDHISCRKFHVNADGVIDSVYAGTNYVPAPGGYTPVPCVHLTGSDVDHAELGAITVQLYPFDDTPNNGGVYKVWVTRVEDFAGAWGADYVPVNKRRGGIPVNGELYQAGNYHGFVPSRSKTDNYKVRETLFVPPVICVKKFHDRDLDGAQDIGEEDVLGWGVDATDPLGTTMRRYTPIGIVAGPAGTWSFTEETPANTTQTALIRDGVAQSWITPTVQVVVAGTSGETHQVIYGNAGLGSILVCKINDANANGIADPNEAGVASWPISLTGRDLTGATVGPLAAVTDAAGCTTFSGLRPGQYTVTETIPAGSGWVATGPTSITVNVTSELRGGAIVGSQACVKFTNVRVGSIAACKILDADADGIVDAGEQPVAGWPMTLTGTDSQGRPVGPLTGRTDATGCVSFGGLLPGAYVVTEGSASVGDWVATGPVSVQVALTSGDSKRVTFTNALRGSIAACKVYDADADGVADAGEPPVVGWRMVLTGTTVRGTTVGPITAATDATGCARFGSLLPGRYTVTEIFPTSGGWVATGPTTRTVDLTPGLNAGVIVGDRQTLTFTNYCTGTADFGTKGYWHNKNGLAEIRPSDITYVNALAPYASPSSYFDAGDEPFNGRFADGRRVEAVKGDSGEELAPRGSTLAEVSQFLVDTNATGDRREQLAQQLLAFIFNARLRLGGVGGVLRLPDGSTVDVAQLVNQALAAWGGTDQTLQVQIEAQLDRLNNMDVLPFIAAVPCPVVY